MPSEKGGILSRQNELKIGMIGILCANLQFAIDEKIFSTIRSKNTINYTKRKQNKTEDH